MSTERPLKQASDFDPAVLQLFDQYVHGKIDRDAFLSGAAAYATAGSSALDLLHALSPRYAQAQQISADDPRIHAEFVEFDSPQGYGRARGYLAKPAGISLRLPAVLVVHENRGLNPHIEDVARRLAVAGYLALAPDALFPLGGYPGDEDVARERFRTLDQAKTRQDFFAAAGLLKSHPATNGRLGVVGFCYGGGIANLLGTQLHGVDAAVAFYGGAAPLDGITVTGAMLQLHFAEHDARINANWPAYQAALDGAGIAYEAHSYVGMHHGFHNDTTPRYDHDAATLAWQRTLALFARQLNHAAA